MPTQIYEHYEIIDLYEPGSADVLDEGELLISVYDGLVGEYLSGEGG